MLSWRTQTSGTNNNRFRAAGLGSNHSVGAGEVYLLSTYLGMLPLLPGTSYNWRVYLRDTLEQNSKVWAGQGDFSKVDYSTYIPITVQTLSLQTNTQLPTVIMLLVRLAYHHQTQ